MLARIVLAAFLLPLAPLESGFERTLAQAESALESGALEKAHELVVRALERDRKDRRAWALRARLAERAGDEDDLVWSLHQELRLAEAQKAPKSEVAALRERLQGLDPIAKDLHGMRELFLKKLTPIAEEYEKKGRPHGAIRVHKEILALDPENAASRAAIERIAALPDPSLAGDAKPKDLFADVSREWIAEHDAKHGEWKDRAKLERENYVTYSNAGYEVLVRAGEAMEQMNAFYRVFFRYGTPEDKKSVPKIGLNIFKNRDEYLKLGIGPPAEWSGGHFTGDFVETYVGPGGFEEMVGTLFHEAAHQFVALATRASGWLNEGLASFFEGTRILPNGTVIMNLPANHRLFPLAGRMERGWMSGPDDGVGANGEEPEKAPTFRTVLENEYEWGPPWYAPTWGLVYFLYNFQDPIDGRFIYRDSFSTFIDASGGRVGEGAVENFEEVVLAAPAKEFKGVARPKDAAELVLPKTVAELDAVWKRWIVDLRDEQQGKLEVRRPYFDWARYAAANKKIADALEHYEKGLVAEPTNVDMLLAFGDLLSEELGNTDRATKLALEALGVLESAAEPDEKKIAAVEKALGKLDPKRATLEAVKAEMAAAARAIVARYQAAGRPSMVMEVAWRLGTELDLPELFVHYREAVRQAGRSLRIWELAYDEESLAGWSNVGSFDVFKANGVFLDARFGNYDPQNFDYRVLPKDTVTSGDFSLRADVLAREGEVNFTGFVFGLKDPASFHAYVLFPPRAEKEGAAKQGFVDLFSFFGGGQPKTWRHVPMRAEPTQGRTSAATWHDLRLDVSGALVDLWLDGELLASHEFASADVLRGSFGLIVGPGRAQFRNIRYLALDPRDTAAQIERELRIEQLRGAEGEAVAGSYLGIEPPFPQVQKWVQGKRTNWAEVGAVPQLLVFFSIQQNDLLPIDGWLADLARETSSLGMEFLCLASPNDADALAGYLQEHPFPGAVGVDARADVGIGDTFEQYDILRFNLPRVILLDLDQRVTWEGDPGFVIGDPYAPGRGTFLDDPLRELLEKRKLKELGAWRRRWSEAGCAAIAIGDLATAIALALEAEEFDARFSAEVARAQGGLRALRAALEARAVAVESYAREEAQPALAHLLDLAPLLGVKLAGKELKEWRAALDADAAKDWAKVDKVRAKAMARAKATTAERAAEVAAALQNASGRFCRELAADLTTAIELGDEARQEALLQAAPARPVRWLLERVFGPNP